jgi:NAD(P)H-quinone oxidoreductase subunit 4
VIDLPKVLWEERIPGIVLAILIIILGIQPGWLIKLSEQTTAAFVPTSPTVALQVSDGATLKSTVKAL